MLKQVLSVIENQWGMRPAPVPGIPKGLPFAIFPMQDEGFRILLVLTWDNQTKLLRFKAEPAESRISDPMKPMALQLINDVNVAMSLGRFSLDKDGDKYKVTATATAFVTSEPTAELVELLMRESLSAMNSVKGLVADA